MEQYKHHYSAVEHETQPYTTSAHHVAAMLGPQSDIGSQVHRSTWLGGPEHVDDYQTYQPVPVHGQPQLLGSKIQPPRSQFTAAVARCLSQTARNWWLELLAVLFLVVVFAGMVATLRNYQNQPIPDWPLGFSINTALSVFGVIFRGALLLVANEGVSQLKWHWFSRRRPLKDLSTYDQASRGPWGSLQLLWVARWRHITATIGALITIIAIGIDPFTQAVVSYYSCTAEATNATSHISHLNSFFSRAQEKPSTSVELAIGNSYGDGTAWLPDFGCSVGNCSFSQLYHSIGLCSSCTDKTDQLQTKCATVKNSNGKKECNYTLSTNISEFETYNTTAGWSLEHSTTYAIGTRDIRPSSNDTQWVNTLLTAAKINPMENPTATPAGASRDLGKDPYKSTFIDMVSSEPLMACQCSIYYCIRSYTATIEAGTLKETLQSTSSNFSAVTLESPILGTVRVDCLTPAVRDRLLADGYISAQMEWMAWNGTYLNGTEADNHISGSTDLSIPAHCAYQGLFLNEEYGFDLSEGWSDTLNGTLKLGFVQDDYVGASSAEDGPDILQRLYNNGSITVDSIEAALGNLTTVVSNYLRTQSPVISPDPPEFLASVKDRFVQQGVPSEWNQPVTGSGFVSTSCVHVRWPWLSLPAGLMVAALLFLLTLIIQTGGQAGLKVWKSSQNALIWHGLDGRAEFDSRVLETRNSMDKRARELSVQLGMTPRGWKLVEKDGDV